MTTRTKLALSIITVVAVVGAVLVAAFAGRYAGRDDGFVIDSFERHVVVADDAGLEVTETIEITFLEPRRGIFRDLEAAGPGGHSVSYEVEGVDQGSEDAPWPYRQERTEEGDPRLRIGDADRTLQPGPQTYRLRYRMEGIAFRPDARPDQVQLRLDAPGERWPTEVAATSLTVELPVAPTSVRCAAGTSGTTGACDAPVEEATTVTQTIGDLDPRQTATVAVEFPADALGAAGASLPQEDVVDLEQRAAGASLGVPLLTATFLLLFLLVVPAVVLESIRARRVYRDVVTDPHLHDRVTPTAELEPPDGLAPAELARLAQRTIGQETLLATLIDLELRGVVATTTSDDGERFTVEPGPDAGNARPWEVAVLEALCPNGDPVTFDGEYDEATAGRAAAAQKALGDHAGKVFGPDSRYVHREGGAFRGVGYVLFIVLVLAIGAVVGTVGGPLLDVPFAAVVTAWVGLGVGWGLLGLVWRKERLPLTSEGRDVVARTEAFEHFLDEVHSDRLEFAADQEEIGTTHPAVALLPYAMALGLGSSWLDRFEPLMTEAAQAGRAVPAGPNSWYLHQTTYAAAVATHSSSVTSPSSGGGSFGGGGAGSGGGGGGGGSW